MWMVKNKLKCLFNHAYYVCNKIILEDYSTKITKRKFVTLLMQHMMQYIEMTESMERWSNAKLSSRMKPDPKATA